MIFSSNKSQFFLNSVFVEKVKITLSHLLKKASTFWQISSQLRERLFFPRPGKIHSNICSKLCTRIKGSLVCRYVKKMTAKEEKGHLVESSHVTSP